MFLERLSINGVDSNNNPNKYYIPQGTFNIYQRDADINLPNCTMYCMLRANESCDATSPMKDIAIKGSTAFHNAKYWFFETGMPKGTELREGSIAVFDGNAGHVAYVEKKIDNTHATITHSQYCSNKNVRDYRYWQRIDNQELVVGKATMSGVGKLLGFIYLPINDKRVERNLAKNQVEVSSQFINIRKSPSLSAEKYDGCYCPVGIYNVYNLAEADGNTWYKLDSKSWIAGVDDVMYYEAEEEDNNNMNEWVAPNPVQRNDLVDQIYINNDRGTIRIREDASTSSNIMGVVVNKAYYNVLEKEDKSDFTWYNIGERSWVAGIDEVEFKEATTWIEPSPVDRDETKDQIFVDNNSGQIRIRKSSSLKSEVMGYVVNKAYYNVLFTKESEGYTWYNLGNDSFVAGISEIKYLPSKDPGHWVEPEPVERDVDKKQIYINSATAKINIRKEPSTKAEVMGVCRNKVYYNVISIKKTSAYTWYNIGEDSWVAGVDEVEYKEPSKLPQPVPEDTNKDQLYVGDVLLNIRSEASTNAEKIGVCEKESNYNVLEVNEKSDYTWYKLAEGAWVAGINDVYYYPAGSSRKAPLLKKEIPQLKNELDIALTCVNRSEGTEHYDELYEKVHALNEFIEENFDSFEYDIVDTKEYDEIDVLYTADVHGAWVGYDEDGNYLNPVFNYDDLNNYRTKLKKNNIKALLVDCGDWSRPCRVYDDYVNTGRMISAEQMNDKDYFVSTYGNHEWKWGDNEETISILNKSKSITACNLFKNGKLVYKPYRTAKIGSKKIAVIGIGYPSPNGQGSYDDGVWTYGDYTFLDNDKLFAEVQKHIDYLKANNFDYIVIATHMCKSTYESDSRYKARTDTLIQNTKGLTAVLQGHYNFATNAETITDKGNSPVLLAHEAGANMNSFGRLKIKGNNISSYLLDERSDLNVI